MGFVGNPLAEFTGETVDIVVKDGGKNVKDGFFGTIGGIFR